MKGIKDAMMDMGAHEEGLSIKKSQRPSGGKVLQRLIEFSEERHLPFTELVVGNSAEETPKSKSKGAKSKAVTRKKVADEVEQYAEEMAATGQSLQGASPGSTVLNVTAPEFMLGPPTATGPQWRFIGPSHITNGQTYGESRPIVSGRVSYIAVAPNNGNHILVGAASGGIWESFNPGIYLVSTW